MSRSELTNDEWKRIEPLLPSQNRRGRGRPLKSNRTMLNGMLWIEQSRMPWRDLPERYGPWESVYARFIKWKKAGIWEQILNELNLGVD